MSFVLEYFRTSHKGNIRRSNEDNFLCIGEYMECVNSGTEGIAFGKVKNGEGAIFGVFDGMGGEEMGETAAYIAAKTLSEQNSEDLCCDALLGYCREANSAICRYAEMQGVSAMGTTAAILFFGKKKISVCNIGDSKIFKYSDEGFEQISFDHIALAPFGRKPSLSQNLGIPEDELIISPYLAEADYRDGDVFLICSDGLTDMVEAGEIKSILDEENGMGAAEKLLNKALENGGKDNITFILISVNKEGFFTKLFGEKSEL